MDGGHKWGCNRNPDASQQHILEFKQETKLSRGLQSVASRILFYLTVCAAKFFNRSAILRYDLRHEMHRSACEISRTAERMLLEVGSDSI